MKDEEIGELEYRKLLNKKDPLDKQILELTKKGELDIKIVTCNLFLFSPFFTYEYSYQPVLQKVTKIRSKITQF